MEGVRGRGKVVRADASLSLTLSILIALGKRMGKGEGRTNAQRRDTQRRSHHRKKRC